MQNDLDQERQLEQNFDDRIQEESGQEEIDEKDKSLCLEEIRHINPSFDSKEEEPIIPQPFKYDLHDIVPGQK